MYYLTKPWPLVSVHDCNHDICTAVHYDQERHTSCEKSRLIKMQQNTIHAHTSHASQLCSVSFNFMDFSSFLITVLFPLFEFAMDIH